MVKVRALKTFSSTVWGNVSSGDVFEVDEGYVKDLEAQGAAVRVDAPKPAAKAPSLDETLNTLRQSSTQRNTGRGRR